MAVYRINAELSQADQQAVLAAANGIRQKLPFLIDLTPAERRSLATMGDKRRGFVARALVIAAQNEGMLPRSFDVAEMRRDVALLESLRPILTALAQLHELVGDTYMAVGSEAYTSALLVYHFARSAGKGAALDSALETLGQPFARKSRSAPADKKRT